MLPFLSSRSVTKGGPIGAGMRQRVREAIAVMITPGSTDTIMHPRAHKRPIRREAVLNVLQSVGARGVQKKLTNEGSLDVGCDIHPFMRASIMCSDIHTSPYRIRPANVS